jgi:hypothetical protein
LDNKIINTDEEEQECEFMGVIRLKEEPKKWVMTRRRRS